MKKLFIVFIFLIGMPIFVYADKWTDEGNYNPNWQDKCPYGMCYFDSEEDLAGVLKSYAPGSGKFQSEHFISKATLDFTAHDWVSTNGRVCPLLAQKTIKVRAGQGFCVASHPTTTVEYLCTVGISRSYNGRVIPDKEEGWTGEIATFKVYPDEGYELNDIYYSDDPTHISYHSPLHKIDDETYTVALVAQNVYVHAIFYPIPAYYINQNLGEGVTSSFTESTARRDTHLDILYTVQEGYEISKVLLDGEEVSLTNNHLIFDVTHNHTIEVRTINHNESFVDRSLAIKNYVNNQSSVVAKSNEKLEYRVVVENHGNVTSRDVIVVSQLPKEISYVENSASNQGVYDANNHTVSWTISELPQNQSQEFSYQGRLNQSAKSGTDYMSSSYVKDGDNDPIYSEKTIVRYLSASTNTNPKTFQSFAGIFLIFILVSFVVFAYFYQKISTE